MKTLNGVREKVILTILPVNVRNIMHKSANVPVTITILNAMPSNGVPITDIIPNPVLCRPLLTDNVQTVNLIINNVKKTDHVPVVNKVMSIPVLRGGCMQLQTVVLMTILTANAVPLRPLPVVRPIIP